ncbi:MAG: hypothetical protein KDA84_23155 [Planctomycetaceae bacterium]|nr:hypothetical protein [Planctomycetaceae bacterium]
MDLGGIFLLWLIPAQGMGTFAGVPLLLVYCLPLIYLLRDRPRTIARLQTENETDQLSQPTRGTLLVRGSQTGGWVLVALSFGLFALLTYSVSKTQSAEQKPNPSPRSQGHMEPPVSPEQAYKQFFNSAVPLLQAHDRISQEFRQLAQRSLTGKEDPNEIVPKARTLKLQMADVAKKLERVPTSDREIREIRDVLVQETQQRTQMIDAFRTGMENPDITGWDEKVDKHRREAERLLGKVKSHCDTYLRKHGISAEGNRP